MYHIEDKPILTYNSLVVDENRYTVSYDGKTLTPPKKIFDLLKLFISNPGVYLSRNQIINLIWPSDVIVLDRTVDVHIVKIKKLLDDKDLIVNLKGRGYKLNENIK